MLAALRVLHVDCSHAPAEIARIEEQPSLTPAPAYSLTSTQPQSNRTKKTRRRLREEPTCVLAMSGNGIHTPEATLDIIRPAEALLPNSPSCGNQPANISPTAPVA
jgi:hypothetical protein